jgi:hypothetical protein
MMVRGENKAIMVVIRAESTELNYDMGGDDGGIIAMLRFSPPVISSSWFVSAYTVRADLVIRLSRENWRGLRGKLATLFRHPGCNLTTHAGSR